MKTGVIKDIEVSHPEFIHEFKTSNSINANILVCSQDKFVKIYHNEDENIDAKLQNYYNFLPRVEASKQDRNMSI